MPAPEPSTLPLQRMRPAARWGIKLALVGSVLLSSLIAMWPTTQRPDPVRGDFRLLRSEFRWISDR